MIVVLSCSLNPESNSRILASEAMRVLEAAGQRVELVDLRTLALPFCDGGAAYGDPNVARLTRHLEGAAGVLIATPIYNYDATAALKNVIELTGSSWADKVVGFLCAAGGMSSYMSIMSFANSLMLDFRSIIVPRFVYATSDAFSQGGIADPEIKRRVGELALATARMAHAFNALAA